MLTAAAVSALGALGLLALASRAQPRTSEALLPGAPAALVEHGPTSEPAEAPLDGKRSPPREPAGRLDPSLCEDLDRAVPQAAVRRPPGSRGENDFVRELRALARDDPAAFATRAERVLGGDGPACEQMALLRSAYAERLPGAPALFARALRELPDESSALGEAVPASIVRWLGARAPRERAARELLERLVCDEGATLSASRRGPALRALLDSAPEPERARLSQRLAGETDPELRACVARFLAEQAADGTTDTDGVEG